MAAVRRGTDLEAGRARSSCLLGLPGAACKGAVRRASAGERPACLPASRQAGCEHAVRLGWWPARAAAAWRGAPCCWHRPALFKAMLQRRAPGCACQATTSVPQQGWQMVAAGCRRQVLAACVGCLAWLAGALHGAPAPGLEAWQHAPPSRAAAVRREAPRRLAAGGCRLLWQLALASLQQPLASLQQPLGCFCRQRLKPHRRGGDTFWWVY